MHDDQPMPTRAADRNDAAATVASHELEDRPPHPSSSFLADLDWFHAFCAAIRSFTARTPGIASAPLSDRARPFKAAWFGAKSVTG
mgnify:CR=1 FL=1